MQTDKDRSGVYFLIAIPLIAVLFWALSPSVSFNVTTWADTASLLGRVFGIIGMMLFAESLLLSSKFKVLEEFFYGLNRVYIKHGQVGQIGFMFMLFHPLSLIYQYTDLSFRSILSFFTPNEFGQAITFGQVGFYLLIVLIFLTLYFRPKYHIWKWTHKFMGIAFFLIGMHAYLIPSDTSTYLPLRIYVLVVSGVALCVYFYHTILDLFIKRGLKYRVSKVKILGDGITEVILKPVKEKIDFLPGQFAFITFKDKHVSSESHPFSISSGLGDEKISFTIKNLGDWTQNINKLSEGSEALVEGPFGKFTYSEAEFKKQIWIAGGIGVTPFISMAKSLKEEDGYRVDLYYCVKNPSEAVYLNELQKIGNNLIHIIPHYSDTAGYINATIINDKSGSLDRRSIFICSPVPMIQALRRQFATLGVPGTSIYSEEFSL